MPFARLVPIVPVALLLACGDSGGDSDATSMTGATNITGVTGVTGVTGMTATATTTAATTSESGASASGSTSGDATDASASASATQPTTGDPSASGTGGTTDIDPFDSTSSADATTWDSFGDSTGGDPLCKQQIDIVFVMDVSTSMLGVLQKLEDEILTVDAKLKTLDVLPDVHYGLVVFVDDTQIINAGAPYLDVNQLKADFSTWWMFTQSNSQVNGGGSNGDWPENSIDALYTASAAFQWRPVDDTLRMVIHCTDDTFGEKGAVQSGITILRTYAETVQSLQDNQVRVFAFADNDSTGGPGNNEDVSMGFFTPYNGQTPIPEATDGGAFNINLVNKNQLSLSAAINDSVESSLCEQYIPM